MKHLNLTKGSERELRGWHGGSGEVFRSDGTGNGISICGFRLWMGQDGCARLMLGNLKPVKLSPEQTAALDAFVTRDNDDE
jgi:hypothetical protein